MIIPEKWKNKWRRIFYGPNLDEILSNLKQKGIFKISLKGYAEDTGMEAICSQIFYVKYTVDTKDNETLCFTERVCKKWSDDWIEDINHYLNERKEILEKEFSGLEIEVKYAPSSTEGQIKPP